MRRMLVALAVLASVVPVVSAEPMDLPPTTGVLECSPHVNATSAGVPRVHEAHLECRAGERVIVTPDPFLDPSE